MNSLGDVTMETATVAGSPAQPNSVVRLADLASAISGRAPASHGHSAGDISGLEAAVSAAIALILTPDASVEIGSLSGGLLGVSVRVKPESGIEKTDDGIGLILNGAGAVALQSYVDERTHAVATGGQTSSVTVSVDAMSQEVTAEAVLDPEGAIEVGSAGLKLRFGTGATDAAPGNHSHPGDFQLPITVANAGRSVVIVQSGTGNQYLAADVRLDMSTGEGTIPLSLTASGLAIPVGTDSESVATGDHSHSIATGSEAGFLSAADKVKLDGIGGAPQPFPFYRRLSDTVLKGLSVAMDAPLLAPIVLEAYVGPSLVNQTGTGVTVTIPLGTSGTTSFVNQNANLTIAAGDLLRLKVVSGTSGGGDSGHCAALIFTT
jgi:hypothetical protein